MIKINKKKFEDKLGFKLKDNIKCLGLDCASKSGWATIKSINGEVSINYGFIDVKSKDSNFKYDQIINIFQDLFKDIIKESNKVIVIEDTFLFRNAGSFKMLTRIGMIAYTLAHINNINKYFIGPSTARAKLGFKGNAKKEFVHDQIEQRLKLGIEDPDIVDAIILSLNGAIMPKGLPI